MQAYRIAAGHGIDSLAPFQPAARDPGRGEVRVRVHAASLNYRDLMVARGEYLARRAEAIVPGSDAAGEVIAVGGDVSRFRAGDRVVTSFFPRWIDGDPTPRNTAVNLGAIGDGVLAEEIVLPEDAFVGMPAHLTFVEGAALPCAAVTAWNALFVAGALKPGDSVLLLGTGGVSIFALQLAKAAGLRAIVTSSSDAKLARARELGADETLNYRATAEWQDEVLRMTGGRGVDLVAEVGGEGTLPRSLAATRMGGTIAMIGGVSGFGAGGVTPLALIGGAKRLVGIYVGSRRMAEDLYRFLEGTGLRPVVDRVFPFAQAKQAYQHLAEGQHFGKIVIRVRD